MNVDQSSALAWQSHCLLQIGVALFLFTSFWGFAVEYVAAPRLGLSAHSLAALQGVILLVLGLVWPGLSLAAATSWIALWCLIYSTFAILAAYLTGAIRGAGNETMPLAAGAAHGSPFVEVVIKIMAYSSAPTGIVSFALVLWGLRAASPHIAGG